MPRNHDNWLSSYIKYALPVSEVEERGHRWIGLSTLAAALGRRVWIDQITFRWFPNMFVAIVSEAGMSKTTTLDIGADMLHSLRRTSKDLEAGVVFGPQKATFQAICEKFNLVAKHKYHADGIELIESPLHFSVSEWSTLISANDPEFQDMLINWWDGKPGDRATVYRGDEAPINPIVNMVGCTTLHTFNDMFSARSIEGGFLSRCVIVRVNKARNIAYPAKEALEHPWRDSFGEKLRDDLRHINHLTGAYTLSPEAVEWGTKWYMDFKENLMMTLPAYMMSWANRKQTYLHKLALLNRIGKDDTKVITLEDMEQALEWMQDIEVSMQEVLSGVGMKEMARYAKGIIAVIERVGKGKCSEEIVRNNTFNFIQNAYDWDQLMRGMMEAGMIIRYKGHLLTPDKARSLFTLEEVDKMKVDQLQRLRMVI
jgi:hypothetical protein